MKGVMSDNEVVVVDGEEVLVVKQPYRRGEWTAEAVAADLRRGWTAPLSCHFKIIIHIETGQ